MFSENVNGGNIQFGGASKTYDNIQSLIAKEQKNQKLEDISEVDEFQQSNKNS